MLLSSGLYERVDDIQEYGNVLFLRENGRIDSLGQQKDTFWGVFDPDFGEG